MARTVSLLGVNYSVPEPTDTGYDQTLTNYLVALATAFPQLNGGTQSLTAELDFGASFGIKSLYYKSRTANPAAAGQIRFGKTDSLSYRNNANGADLALGIDTGDALTFNGANVTGNPFLSATSAAGQVIGNGTTTIVVFGTVETDSDSGYNAGTGRYTIPTGKGGDYEISSLVQMTTTQAGAADTQVFKNGAALKYLQIVSTQTANVTVGGTLTVRLAAGDIIDIRFENTGAGGQTLKNTAAVTYFTMKRIPT